MSNDQTQIAAIKSQTLARIAEITAEPKPSYTIDGQSIAWADYLRALRGTVDWCDARLAALAPCEIRSRGISR